MTVTDEKDMVLVGGVLRPATYEKARELADKQFAPIQAARDKVLAAEIELHRVCVEAYPVGSRVNVNIAARRTPTHDIIAVNEHGCLTLRNIYTGTVRYLSAASHLITPCDSWYSVEEAMRHGK